MTNPNDIVEDIQKLISLEMYNEASEAYYNYLSELKKSNSPLLAVTYYEYALFLFSLNNYELSILMFQASYNLNYRREDIILFLYDTFLIPNQNEFETNYNTNILNLKKQVIYCNIPNYSKLSLDFIPYDEDKYFIYDKDFKTFEGIIDISGSDIITTSQLNINDEFDDVVITGSWNISQIINIILSSNDKLIYFISSNSLKSLSLLKITKITNVFCNNLYLFDSVDSFQTYLHTNTSISLPRLFHTYNNYFDENILQIIKDEHLYRLTNKGRDTSNIILSICIPSYNRGHRALKNILHLINLPYDSEIEFVVSNNSSTENTTGYDEIAEISDSRIKYFKFSENKGAITNFCNVISIAKGKYACLISDEDTIDLPSISHYLAVLRKNPNLSFVKGKGKLYYTDNSGQIYAQGKEAFIRSFLTTNYVSGLIYRTDIFHSLNIYSWISNQLPYNSAVQEYAHSCWSVLYALLGDYLEDSILLFTEGVAEHDATLTNISNNSKSNHILRYGTKENRFKQHIGFIDILNQISSFIDRTTYFEAFKNLCAKTFLLLNLIKKQYLENGEEWSIICTDISNCCIDSITKLEILPTKEEQIELLNCIYKCNLYYTTK